MSKHATIAQSLFGQPTGDYGTPEWVDSMLNGLLDLFDTCYWNVNQEQFGRHEAADVGPVHFRPYSWGEEDGGPNFWIDGDEQQIRWYKHPGRGQSCAIDYTPEQWIAWHDAVRKALWAACEPKP